MATISYENLNYPGKPKADYTIRDDMVSPRLEVVLQEAAKAAGIDQVVVTSGGQPAWGKEGVDRKGSTRHNVGNAADVKLIVNGQRISFGNPEGQKYFADFAREAAARGATGIGAGKSYMGTGTIHVGFGTKSIWGGSGKTAGTPPPPWLPAAVKAGWAAPVDTPDYPAMPRARELAQTSIPIPPANVPSMPAKGVYGEGGIQGSRSLAGALAGAPDGTENLSDFDALAGSQFQAPQYSANFDDIQDSGNVLPQIPQPPQQQYSANFEDIQDAGNVQPQIPQPPPQQYSANFDDIQDSGNLQPQLPQPAQPQVAGQPMEGGGGLTDYRMANQKYGQMHLSDPGPFGFGTMVNAMVSGDPNAEALQTQLATQIGGMNLLKQLQAKIAIEAYIKTIPQQAPGVSRYLREQFATNPELRAQIDERLLPAIDEAFKQPLPKLSAVPTAIPNMRPERQPQQYSANFDDQQDAGFQQPQVQWPTQQQYSQNFEEMDDLNNQVPVPPVPQQTPRFDYWPEPTPLAPSFDDIQDSGNTTYYGSQEAQDEPYPFDRPTPSAIPYQYEEMNRSMRDPGRSASEEYDSVYNQPWQSVERAPAPAPTSPGNLYDTPETTRQMRPPHAPLPSSFVPPAPSPSYPSASEEWDSVYNQPWQTQNGVQNYGQIDMPTSPAGNAVLGMTPTLPSGAFSTAQRPWSSSATGASAWGPSPYPMSPMAGALAQAPQAGQAPPAFSANFEEMPGTDLQNQISPMAQALAQTSQPSFNTLTQTDPAAAAHQLAVYYDDPNYEKPDNPFEENSWSSGWGYDESQWLVDKDAQSGHGW